jgi:hypothetical protein
MMMHDLTALASWSIADIKEQPELYRAYIRELAVDITGELTGEPMPWPEPWLKYGDD